MIRPKIALVAELVIFDSETGSTTIINVLEAIRPMFPFPWAFPRMVFWVALERELIDPAIGNLKFRLSLNEKEISTAPVNFKFPDDHTVTNLVFNLNGLAVHSEGRLEFRLLNNDGSIFAEYLLTITPMPPTVKMSQPALLDPQSSAEKVTPELQSQRS